MVAVVWKVGTGTPGGGFRSCYWDWLKQLCQRQLNVVMRMNVLPLLYLFNEPYICP